MKINTMTKLDNAKEDDTIPYLKLVIFGHDFLPSKSKVLLVRVSKGH